MRINCSHVRITESTGLSIFPMTEINKVSHKKFNMPKAEHHPGGRVLLFGSPPPLKLWIFWGEEWVPGFYRYPFTLLPRLPRRSEQQFAPPTPTLSAGIHHRSQNAVGALIQYRATCMPSGKPQRSHSWLPTVSMVGPGTRRLAKNWVRTSLGSWIGKCPFNKVSSYRISVFVAADLSFFRGWGEPL